MKHRCQNCGCSCETRTWDGKGICLVCAKHLNFVVYYWITGKLAWAYKGFDPSK